MKRLNIVCLPCYNLMRPCIPLAFIESLEAIQADAHMHQEDSLL